MAVLSGKGMSKRTMPRHIALIGNSKPRRCGIATFTSDCHDALKSRFPEMRIDIYAMDDGQVEGYPDDVHLIAQNDPLAYAEAARRIEESGAEAIWLQHEFGIFGGPAGNLILNLLHRTNLPLFTTLHTLLEQPNDDERQVMDALLERSGQIMVMAEKGRDILRNHYVVRDSLVTVIPHGVPYRDLVDPDAMKVDFGFEGRKLILTFGLLAPDKGLDSMIRAMPGIVAHHPDALYVILGATHPNLVRDQGEALREELQALAGDLGVADHVRFIDQFVEQEELLDFLQAADIYVTPYYNPAQITSGTLSYAVAMGKPVVSTPYVHATEILADDHGILVPFRDSAALTSAIDGLLSDKDRRLSYARRAYARGQGMLWHVLAERAAGLIARARDQHPARLSVRHSEELLPPDLSAILRMSDSTGMLQHSILSVPDRNHGYCIDDNARALMLMQQVDGIDEGLRDQWTTVYAAFVQYGWNPDRRRFRNFMSFEREWLEEEGSQDSNGRAFWSLGVTARDARVQKHRDWAARLYDESLESLATMESPRAQAFVMLGAGAMLDRRADHPRSRAVLEQFGRKLMARVAEAQRDGWHWFESVLAYDNARLPEALLRAARHLDDTQMKACGLATLRWIIGQQTAPAGHFRAVGSESFNRPYQPPLPFDQQPLEAQATIEACEAAMAVDADPFWLDTAHKAYRWFLGQNDLGLPLARRADGGCYDGLTPVGVNQNQGAESLLALQFASSVMKRLSQSPQSVPKAHWPEAESVQG